MAIFIYCLTFLTVGVILGFIIGGLSVHLKYSDNLISSANDLIGFYQRQQEHIETDNN